MDTVKNIVTVIGIVARVGGALWALMSYIDFSSAKKNNDGRGQDMAIWGIILGGTLTVFGPSMANSINASLDSITF